jgi:hypothetical protein
MKGMYKIKKLNDAEFEFVTNSGTKYNLELNEMPYSYYSDVNKKIKKMNLFNFTLVDRSYAFEYDQLKRKTITNFLSKILMEDKNDCFVFFICNEFERDSLQKRRGKLRFTMFKRMFDLYTKRFTSHNYGFFTNQFFIHNPSAYELDFIGIIVNYDSVDYFSIIKSFNKICYDKSYKL